MAPYAMGVGALRRVRQLASHHGRYLFVPPARWKSWRFHFAAETKPLLHLLDLEEDVLHCLALLLLLPERKCNLLPCR